MDFGFYYRLRIQCCLYIPPKTVLSGEEFKVQRSGLFSVLIVIKRFPRFHEEKRRRFSAVLGACHCYAREVEPVRFYLAFHTFTCYLETLEECLCQLEMFCG
eukprot:m.160921 g.160921  ORF g.160921 m.160921 type:complete len:102 (+) comp38791_c0_seq16:140-445(+)